MNKTTHNWTMIDRWDLDDEANGAMLMIVGNENGDRYLLAKLRNHPAGPAAWGMAISVLPTDTRKTLEADAGRNCPMTVWQCALEGYDDDREVMDWASALILNIVNAAK